MRKEQLEVGGCAITVDRCGSGPPLVLLHGERGPHGARAFIERLGKHFEVHVPRHAGWAGTRRADHVATARDVALVQQEYVERLGGPVPLVGTSFGAWIAAEMAANAPSLVSRAVFISPIGVKIGGREERDFVDIYLLPEPERTAIYHASAFSPQFSADADICLEMALADDALVRFGWQPYMHDPGLGARLRRIRASSLVIHGDADRFVLNPDYFREYAALIPGAQHRTLHGLGHRLEEEDPEQVAAIVVDFISEQDAAAPKVAATASMET